MNFQNLAIHWLGHAGFKILWNGKVMYLDPFQISDAHEKADVIFITHSHYDHCSIEDIKKIIALKTKVVCTSDVQSKLAKVKDNVQTIIVEPHKQYNVEDIHIQTIPAYNLNKQFHPRENQWVGYILKFGETTFYHSGDTDLTQELLQVKTDVALLPVSGTYTMTAEEAVRAAESIQPQLAIPMHYGSIVGTEADAEKFFVNCQQKNINAEILEKE
jgi:L-ascorbate metabolism protein UlaG (beta-lactamase superfamily)